LARALQLGRKNRFFAPGQTLKPDRSSPESPDPGNAGSNRNAPGQVRLRQANRLFENSDGPLNAGDLSTITETDIRPISVLRGGLNVSKGARHDI